MALILVEPDPGFLEQIHEFVLDDFNEDEIMFIASTLWACVTKLRRHEDIDLEKFTQSTFEMFEEHGCTVTVASVAQKIYAQGSL